MSRWGALAALLIAAAAFLLRVPHLDSRPLHNDEAVNATKVAELWQNGTYAYDPDEYHGPTLHYATLPFLWLSGAKNPDELKDQALRHAPVFFGIALIALLPIFGGALGSRALLWAALFLAVSPAMVFYSRYFIHEMPLVFFTALAIGAGWRYANSRSMGWAILAGVGLGLMFATKETFVITLAAMGCGLMGTAWWLGPTEGPVKKLLSFWNTRHACAAVAACFVVWLLFFSSFFTNFAGLADSIRTYFPWLKRAGGHSPHIHPWHFYLHRLAWFHPVKGPIWSEGLILVLAGWAAISALARKRSGFHCFLAIYTLALTCAYSIIPYKTPWCLLSFWHGMILLAGLGAAELVERIKGAGTRALAVAAMLGFSAQLGWQAGRASFVYASDRRNPYVYSQTVPDLLNLVHKLEGLAGISPVGYGTPVTVIAPEGDYWPLPWHLRRFKQVGWHESIPLNPFTPIIICSSKLDAGLDEKSGKKWLMAGYTELRPQRFLELYVELELWKKYVATLPPVRD